MRESFESLNSNILVDAFHRKGDRLSVVAQSFTAVTRPAFQSDPVIVWLADFLPELRLQPVLRVEVAAIAIAIAHPLRLNQDTIEQDTVEQGGLMQNLPRFFKPSRLLKIAQDKGLEILHEFL